MDKGEDHFLLKRLNDKVVKKKIALNLKTDLSFKRPWTRQ